jgi:hypothetical protein
LVHVFAHTYNNANKVDLLPHVLEIWLDSVPIWQGWQGWQGCFQFICNFIFYFKKVREKVKYTLPTLPTLPNRL